MAVVLAGVCTVTLNDVDVVLLEATALNFEQSGLNLAKVVFDARDWIEYPDKIAGAYDVVLAGDICYDRMLAAEVMTWLRSRFRVTRLAKERERFGDPGRDSLPVESLVPIVRFPIAFLTAGGEQ